MTSSWSQLDDQVVTVEVLGIVEGRAAVDQLLEGWQDAMVKPNSVSWVRERVAQLSLTMGRSVRD